MLGAIVGTLSGLLLLFLVGGVFIGVSLGVLAVFLDFVFVPDRLMTKILGQAAWASTNSFVLVAAPLFIFMGVVLFRTGLAERLYHSLSLWLNVLPGGLLHTNIGAGALFAASSGSVVATAATVGEAALPSFRQRGYSEKLVTGSIAAGGTLGYLIPPSLGMIWFSLLTGVSLGKLLIAGVFPGIMLSGMFMLAIAVISLLNPGVAPRETAVTWGARLKTLPNVIPIGLIIVSVMGSIYAGWATPTEAAAVGLTASLALAISFRRLTLQVLLDSAAATARITAMFGLILVAVHFLDILLAFLRVTSDLAEFVGGLDVSPLAILAIIILFYILLGMFMDDVAITFATVPVLWPVIQEIGAANPGMAIFDGVAFGILTILLLQMAIITPPVGINLYVIQSIRGGGRPISDVYLGVLPFAACMLLAMVALIAFPEIALWLPSKAFS